MELIVLSSLIPILHSLISNMKMSCYYYYDYNWHVLRVISHSCSDRLRENLMFIRKTAVKTVRDALFFDLLIYVVFILTHKK